jgi:AbrB family looped-hinge helix DNA binding protein
LSQADDQDCMRAARPGLQLTALSIKYWGAMEVAVPKSGLVRKSVVSMWTVTIRSRGRITLPKDLLQHLGVGPGDEIEFELLPDGHGDLMRGRTTKIAKNGHSFEPAIESARKIMIRRRDALRELAK